jgi:hypothetical protein
MRITHHVTLKRSSLFFLPTVKGDLEMKNMQSFYKKLLSVTETSLPQQRRLASLTRLGRTQLLKAASDLAWDIWGAATIVAVS